MGRKHLTRDMARAGAKDRRRGTPAGAPARTSPPKVRDAILAYPTTAAGLGSLFSDVPSYRRCEATTADLTGKMKIVVIGGTGLIGSKTVPILRQRGHEVIAASPNTGVNSITGEGPKEAMAGTQAVIGLA